MKKLLLLLTLLFSSLLPAQRVISVYNPGNNKEIPTYITRAINAASVGDTISLGAGYFYHTQDLTITKKVHFKGVRGRTFLVRPESMSEASLANKTMWTFTGVDDISIDGIIFKSKLPSDTTGDGKSTAQDVGIYFNLCHRIDFKYCEVWNFTRGILVKHEDSLLTYPVYIHDCTFEHNAKQYDGQGIGYGVQAVGQDLVWIVNPDWNSNKFVIIRNCRFNKHRHAWASSGCAKLDVSYCHVTNNYYSVDAITAAGDTHWERNQQGAALGSGNYYATRATKAHHNYIVYNTFYNRRPLVPGQNVSRLVQYALYVRGGDCLYYSNVILGARFGILHYIDGAPSSRLPKVWYYSNTFVPYAASGSQEYLNAQPQYFVPGTHIFTSAPSGYIEQAPPY